MSRRAPPPVDSGSHAAHKKSVIDEALGYLHHTPEESYIDDGIKELVELVVEIVECTWAFLCDLWMKGVMFIIILIIGFLWYGIYLGTVDGMMIFVDVLNVISDVMSGLSSAISTVSGGLSSAASFLSGGHSRDIQVSIPTGISMFQPVYGDIEDILATCAILDTWGRVLMAFIKIYFGTRGCYTIRFFYPIPVIYNVLYYTIGWFTEDPAPYPWANCRVPSDETLCVWLRFYLIIIYFMIPAIVVVLFISKFWPVIRRLGRWLWYFVRIVFKYVVWSIRFLRAVVAVREANEERAGY